LVGVEDLWRAVTGQRLLQSLDAKLGVHAVGEPPPALTRLRKRLGRGDEADRRFVRVLAAVILDGLEAVEGRGGAALDAGAAATR
jgi:hypothetical protein